jgi:RNA polymerase sigma-70 factor (ECF subfamily)
VVALTPDQNGYDVYDQESRHDAEAQGWTPPAWEDVVREHGDRVYRLAYRLSGNQHDAEDITQETFIRVFRSLSNYKPGSFEGWLHRIATNVFLDMVRRRQRIRMEALGEESDRIVGREPSPEQVYSDSTMDPDLQAALDELAPEFRAAVVLCDVEGLTYEEVGATLGIKIGTVRSRIHRGRRALREGLERRRAERTGHSTAAQGATGHSTTARGATAQGTTATTPTTTTRATPPGLGFGRTHEVVWP